MANNLLTIDMITREALRLFINSNAFLRNINRQYDDQFARSGAKIGETLRIRLPNDYTVRTGQTAVVQGTNEQSTSLTVSTQKGVDVSFSSADRALSLDDYSTRVLRPMMNNLAGAVAADVMTLADSVPNYVANVDTGGALLTPSAETWLLAGAKLDQLSAPRQDRKIIMDPLTQARTVSSLAGLFNPQRKISDQYQSGELTTDTLGFDWMMDQTVEGHTVGTFTAGPVNGANQTGNAITVTATTGTLVKGDIITFAGVFGVNRVTKASTGQLAQFVVTANVAAGSTSIPIYPALIPAGAGGVAVQYQTVTASPANAAVVALVAGEAEGSTYRKNLAYYPDAFTLATADLELPRGVHEASRAQYGGISLRSVTQYDITSDNFITRIDILYGYTAPRAEWAVVVPDIL